MYVTPDARPAYNAPISTISITFTPLLNVAQFLNVMHPNPQLQSTLIPTLYLNLTGPNTTTFFLPYSAKQSLIAVSALLDNQYYMVDWAIVDNGAGISKDHISIFL